jgi:xanthine dehydrogenase accessory factor
MFDKAELLDAVMRHRVVARVVVAGFEGSSPRETGAAMLVWADGQSGTIGGGALEWQAIAQACGMLGRVAGPHLARVPLGPSLGQCCGGAVTLLTEVYDQQAVAALPDQVIARPVDGREMPLAVKRLLGQARGTGALPPAQLLQGWMVEPVARAQRQLWIWGAGHVGRALVGVFAPLPDVAITWVDVAMERFPDVVRTGVRVLPVANPTDAVGLAPPDAEHLILTYSHALDLDLCHRLLLRGFGSAGLIGSATKWARFRSRLAALGHDGQSIARIQCPIGDPALGKHPQQIAIGVAAAFLRGARRDISRLESIL